MSNNGVTKDGLMRILPAPLNNDAGMRDLGETAAQALTSLWGAVDLPSIYIHIDSMSEEILDILAKDFKIDWYDYNFSVQSKRTLFKDSFFVHKHLGTKGALIRALSDIYPLSTLEEWFEYDGEPFYFRIILDATYAREPIRMGSTITAINFYKSMRSHLEHDMPVVRITCNINMKSQRDGQSYSARVCGTFPAVATHGNVTDATIQVKPLSDGATYTVPLSGQMVTGSYPCVAAHGDVSSGDMGIGVNAEHSGYMVRLCGTPSDTLF